MLESIGGGGEVSLYMLYDANMGKVSYLCGTCCYLVIEFKTFIVTYNTDAGFAPDVYLGIYVQVRDI